jgi:histidinol dehydrogenase
MAGSIVSARSPLPLRLDTARSGFASAFAALLASKREIEERVDESVAAILSDIRARGDDALFEYTRRFDRLALTPATLRIAPDAFDAAERDCAPDRLAALRLAAERIESYHRTQLPQPLDYRDAQGVRLGARWTAIGAVGLYVPGGTAAYPSSVLMNAIPAKVAGVPRVAMAVPAPEGKLNPLVLAAAKLAGVREAYRIGGAQAVGALAYGTPSIAAVDKIVGPGNAYVAAAKRRVFGTVGIDMIAGPSEILVVADGGNDPAWIAADLLSQAEHDGAAQSILITEDRAFADAVAAAVETQLARLPRGGIASESWAKHGAIIAVRTLDEAVDLVDRIAPEHLELAVPEPDGLAARIRNAGAIFLGRYTPEAVGDYVGGPNHVLPTSGSARFSSGLGVLDFMKRTSILGCDAAALGAIGPAAVTLAEAEGLEAHARSIAIRLNLPRG